MPSLKAIRNRIASVKNTQKITRAMKLVAAARLRRAQDAMQAARPYAKHLAEVVADLSARMSAADPDAPPAHPLLVHRDAKRARLIVVSSDRGLAGGYNSNLNRRVERFIVDEKPNYQEIELAIVGRKAREHFRRCHQGRLRSCLDGNSHSHQGHHRLTRADVALKEAQHPVRRGHVLRDIDDGLLLRVRQRERQRSRNARADGAIAARLSPRPRLQALTYEPERDLPRQQLVVGEALPWRTAR